MCVSQADGQKPFFLFGPGAPHLTCLSCRGKGWAIRITPTGLGHKHHSGGAVVGGGHDRSKKDEMRRKIRREKERVSKLKDQHGIYSRKVSCTKVRA